MGSYIDESLTRNEVLIRRFPLHWTAWISFWACVVLGFPTLGLLWLVALYLYLRNKGLERAVTSKRVIQKTGIISRNTDEMKIGSVETVEIEQGVLQRLLGSGTVRVTGRGISDVVMKSVDDPMGVKKAIDEAEYHRVDESAGEA